MKPEQFAERIGNIDDQLVAQAQQTPNYGALKRHSRFKRFITAVATLVLMATSFTAGALACSQETIIEVPMAQEQIVLEDMGLTIILPDDWNGRYALEPAENDWGYFVYCPQIRQAMCGDPNQPMGGGMLFYIYRIDQALTPDEVENSQWSMAPNRYLFATKDSTYLLYFASDVQFTPETEEEYRTMEQQVQDIRIIIHQPLAE